GSAVFFLTADVGLEARSLAAQVAQVVELRAAGTATANHRDGADQWRVDGEHALDAFAEGHLADHDGAARALAVLAGDDDALESLHAGAAAFDDLVVDADGVTAVELGDVVTDERLLDRAQDGAFVVLHHRLVSRWVYRTGPWR